MDQSALPSFLAEFLRWAGDNHLGDLSGILGVLVSIIGFGVTLTGVLKSKRAAQRAEEASRQTRDSIRLLDAVVDFSSAIAILEEIKRAHRQQQWSVLPDRYAAIRKLLIALRATNSDLSDVQKAAIQTALANLTYVERAVERGLVNPASLKPTRFNAAISTDIDNLQAILVELKTTKSGGR
jgi:hypothetical protein